MRSLFPPLGLERLPYIANYTVQIVYLSDSKNLRTTLAVCAVRSEASMDAYCLLGTGFLF